MGLITMGEVFAVEVLLIPLGVVFVVMLVGWWMTRRIRNRRIDRRRPAAQGVAHERASLSGVPWPVRPYVISTITASTITKEFEEESAVQEWLVSWPQLEEWGQQASKRPGVAAMAVYEDRGARISTAWTWEDGRLAGKTVYPWSWQSALRAHGSSDSNGKDSH
ncbi:hypothetical protein [Streptosporangium amethystogenes]|uniref:hypothetical protein n=1 Tax=Streptosporangium amethystogenes TaxID=2002 RepID=UPI0004C7C3A0|nr:hypothetical protein [Streptosporangium amethystogenes]